MKKLLCILLAAGCLFCFAACGGVDDVFDPDDDTTTEENNNQEDGGGTVTETMYYNNPLLEEDCADPHILRYGDTFYIYSTGGVIHKSTDMVNWETVGTLGISPDWGTSGAGIWAPDIVQIGDKFVIYYSLSVWGDSNPGIGVATADHPEGPWTDHGKLFLSSEIGVDNSIDPSGFIAEDGNVYLVWGSFRGVFGVQLSDDGLSLKGGIEYAAENKTLIAGVVGAWDGATFEAPYIIYKDGYYYLFASSGTCCDGLNSTYHVRVGRSTSPLGEYVDSDGKSMKNRNVGHVVVQSSSKLVGPGHNSIFIDDEGTWYLIYHAWLNVDGTGYGRYLCMDPLIWDDDGWCEVKNKMPSTKAKAPVIVSSVQ